MNGVNVLIVRTKDTVVVGVSVGCVAITAGVGTGGSIVVSVSVWCGVVAIASECVGVSCEAGVGT